MRHQAERCRRRGLSISLRPRFHRFDRKGNVSAPKNSDNWPPYDERFETAQKFGAIDLKLLTSAMTHGGSTAGMTFEKTSCTVLGTSYEPAMAAPDVRYFMRRRVCLTLGIWP